MIMVNSSSVSSLSNASDQELVEHFHNCGDDSAIEELIHRHGEHIVQYSARFCGNSADAADIAQNTLLTLWTNLDQVRFHQDSLRPWLVKTAQHKALMYLRTAKRRRQRERKAADETQRQQEPQQAANEDHHELQIIESLIADLHPVDQAIINLHYRQEKSFIDIAESMECNVNTVRSRHRRALEQLRQRSSKTLQKTVQASVLLALLKPITAEELTAVEESVMTNSLQPDGKGLNALNTLSSSSLFSGINIFTAGVILGAGLIAAIWFINSPKEHDSQNDQQAPLSEHIPIATSASATQDNIVPQEITDPIPVAPTTNKNGPQLLWNNSQGQDFAIMSNMAWGNTVDGIELIRDEHAEQQGYFAILIPQPIAGSTPTTLHTQALLSRAVTSKQFQCHALALQLVNWQTNNLNGFDSLPLTVSKLTGPASANGIAVGQSYHFSYQLSLDDKQVVLRANQRELIFESQQGIDQAYIGLLFRFNTGCPQLNLNLSSIHTTNRATE